MVNVKKIIITGSSSGIGKSITKELIKKKIKVIGISRNNNESLIKSKYFQSEEIDLSELKNKNDILKEAVLALNEKLNDINLANAKLLYTNKALNSASLNGRQRNKIVESIESAVSVVEAKTIFETLQNAVSAGSVAKSRTANSLSEAVRRNSSPYAIRGNESEPQKLNDAFSDRMRRLAGINK